MVDSPLGQAINFPGFAESAGPDRGINYGNIFGVGTGEISVSMWFNLDLSGAHDQRLVSRSANGSTNAGWSVTAMGTDRVRIYLGRGMGNANLNRITDEGTLTSNEWHHLAFTLRKDEDGRGIFTAYLNGDSSVFAGTASLPTGYDIIPNASIPMYVGRGSTLINPTHGMLDDLAIWDRPLTSDEIDEIYEKGLLGRALLDEFDPTLSGDYNGDGFVNLADYTVWRDTLGAMGTGLAADGNGDEAVNALDYDVWKDNFGESLGSVSSLSSRPVPEPSTFVVLGFGLLATMAVCRRNGRGSTAT